MKTILLTLAAAASALALPALPAAAAMAPQNGVLIIYGDDKCPTNDNGEEIVVCVRRPAGERFRIPSELRDAEVSPQRESWAVRQRSALTAGDTGIGSCTTVGPGGGIGCSTRDIQAGKAEADSRKKAEKVLPD
jgi:nitroreductase